MITKGKSKTVRMLEKMTGRPLTFGGAMEAYRLGEEYSLVKMAKELGVSPSHLCDIEKGRKVVSPERAAKFAKIIGRSQILFVSLAMQDMLDKNGIKMRVTLTAA